ncbi:hypothetical protein [Enterovibrio paralichthyis]|uniref:hypothetical protein n=1 Tax=Enterovibrio paralichthyis TaxID=2853805 RepID=UPI001C44A255|nr:hypothetical protein [Enterovibrio paralichthyis]MBV7298397.1 hypothetical protein [Enterovibrio paralichthyis]
MNNKEFNQLLERVNQSRKAALQDETFLARAQSHAEELTRQESMDTRPVKRRPKKKASSAPKRFANVYEGFADGRSEGFCY